MHTSSGFPPKNRLRAQSEIQPRNKMSQKPVLSPFSTLEPQADSPSTQRRDQTEIHEDELARIATERVKPNAPVAAVARRMEASCVRENGKSVKKKVMGIRRARKMRRASKEG